MTRLENFPPLRERTSTAALDGKPEPTLVPQELGTVQPVTSLRFGSLLFWPVITRSAVVPDTASTAFLFFVAAVLIHLFIRRKVD